MNTGTKALVLGELIGDSELKSLEPMIPTKEEIDNLDRLANQTLDTVTLDVKKETELLELPKGYAQSRVITAIVKRIEKIKVKDDTVIEDSNPPVTPQDDIDFVMVFELGLI